MEVELKVVLPGGSLEKQYFKMSVPPPPPPRITGLLDVVSAEPDLFVPL